VKVGIPREVKNHEYRVAITPAGVKELVSHGHEVFVETDAGVGSSITNDEYVGAGAKILATADDVWAEAELVLKVKEPVAEEYHRMRADQVLFTYLHLAASRPCTDALLASGTTGVAYETVQRADKSLPLLAPMSEVAGRMAPQVGAHCLERRFVGDVEQTRRELVQPPPHRVPVLVHEEDLGALPLAPERDHRDGTRVLDDVALRRDPSRHGDLVAADRPDATPEGRGGADDAVLVRHYSGSMRESARWAAAATSPANSGCARVGRDRNSGWAWVPT
jgi:hypothetical protein